MTCNQLRRRLVDSFLRQRAAPEGMHDHLENCAACREYHERVFAAVATLAGPGGDEPDALTPPEQELLLARVLPRRRAAVRPLLLAGSVVAAAAALLIIAILPRAGPETDVLAPRGTNRVRGRLALRPLCLSRANDGYRARSMVVRAACSVDDELGFSYRNETGELWYLRVVVMDDGGARVVVPRSEGAAPAEPTRGEEAWSETVPLRSLGRAGQVRFLALFSRRPDIPLPEVGGVSGAVGEDLYVIPFEVKIAKMER